MKLGNISQLISVSYVYIKLNSSRPNGLRKILLVISHEYLHNKYILIYLWSHQYGIKSLNLNRCNVCCKRTKGFLSLETVLTPNSFGNLHALEHLETPSKEHWVMQIVNVCSYWSLPPIFRFYTANYGQYPFLLLLLAFTLRPACLHTLLVFSILLPMRATTLLHDAKISIPHCFYG